MKNIEHLTRPKEVWSDARPHPGPLPRGVGEPFADARDYLRLCLPYIGRGIKARATAVPSPGREGQAEGGRSTILRSKS